MNREQLEILTKELRENVEKVYNYTQYNSKSIQEYETNRKKAQKIVTEYCILPKLKDFENLVSIQTGTIINYEDFKKKSAEFIENEKIDEFVGSLTKIIEGFSEWRPFEIMSFVVRGGELINFLNDTLTTIIAENIENKILLQPSSYDTKQKIKHNYDALKFYQKAAEQLRRLILGLNISVLPENTSELLNLKFFTFEYFNTRFGMSERQFVEISQFLFDNDFLMNSFFPLLISFFENLKVSMELNSILKKQWFIAMTAFWTLKMRSDFHNFQIVDTLLHMNPNLSTTEIVNKIMNQPLIQETEFLEELFFTHIIDFDQINKQMEVEAERDKEIPLTSTHTIFE